MEEVERIAYEGFNAGLTKSQWKEEWAKLKESGAYEYSLGDLVLSGIAHCTQKDILIFNTSPLAHSPVYVIEASTFLNENRTDTEIPVFLHMISLVPNTPEDIQKTSDLKKTFLQGN